jgi:hypothetical protein
MRTNNDILESARDIIEHKTFRGHTITQGTVELIRKWPYWAIFLLELMFKRQSGVKDDKNKPQVWSLAQNKPKITTAFYRVGKKKFLLKEIYAVSFFQEFTLIKTNNVIHTPDEIIDQSPRL